MKFRCIEDIFTDIMYFLKSGYIWNMHHKLKREQGAGKRLVIHTCREKQEEYETQNEPHIPPEINIMALNYNNATWSQGHWA